MAYGLPARGQADWDDELNNSIESLRADVQSAVSAATSAQSNANSAKNTADSALATANSAGNAATHATDAANSASSAALYANGAQASAAAAQTAQTGAETARAGAEAVGNTNDTIIAGRVNDSTSATTTALKSSYAPVVTPQKFDSLAGTSGHDSTAALQSALDATGDVWLPPGTYNVSAPLVLTKKKKVWGSGVDTCTLVGTASMSAVLIVKMTRAKLYSFYVNAGGTGKATNGIVAQQMGRGLMEDIKVTSAADGYGIAIYGKFDGDTTSYNNNELELRRCEASLCNVGMGMPVKGTDNNNVVFFHCTSNSNTTVGLMIKGQDDHVYFGNYFSNPVNIQLGDEAVDAGAFTTDVDIHKPWLESAGTADIRASLVTRATLHIDLPGKIIDGTNASRVVVIEKNVSGSTGEYQIHSGTGAGLSFIAGNIKGTHRDGTTPVPILLDGTANAAGVKVGNTGDKIGWFGTTPSAKATITGTRADGTALANLLTELAAKGLITNSSTAGVASSNASYAFKTADTVRNNVASRTADPDLSIAVTPGTYLIESYLNFNATTTADLGIEWLLPGSSTLTWSPFGPNNNASNGSGINIARYAAQSVQLGGIAAPIAAAPRGHVVITTSGNVQLAWAQWVAEVSDATLLAGSWLRLTKVA